MAESEYFVPDIGYFIFRKGTINWKIEESKIDFCDITYVTEGHAWYVVDGVVYEVRAGDLMCIPLGSIRSAAIDPTDLMGCYSANFQVTNLHGVPVRIPFPPLTHIGLRVDLLQLFRELSGVWLCKEPGYVMRAQAIFMLILCRVFELTVYKKDSYAIDPRIRKTMRYISDHYDATLTVAELAAIAELGPVYYGALFKQNTGMTVNRYITQIRINHAENMLRSGEYTIGETAERCGYSDVHYFRKQFKEVMGCLPSKCLLER